ncbi:MAG: hypothetical protein IJ309_06325 [Clostridia bacterium]|nr:hypothetical protein [Clostridia bacterium]
MPRPTNPKEKKKTETVNPPSEEDYSKPKGDLLIPEIKAICRLCRVANNRRMITQKVECERTERTGMYCRLIENLRVAYQSQAQEINLCRKYSEIFMGSCTCIRQDELRTLYENKAAITKGTFQEFLDFCRIIGMNVLE